MPEEQLKQANLRGVEQALIISVLEGNGTEEDIYEIVRYVVMKDGSTMGKIDENWIYREPRKLK